MDHHICSAIVTLLVEKYPTYSWETVRSAIWMCSSGINRRAVRKRTGGYKEVRNCWTDIEHDFKEMGDPYSMFKIDEFCDKILLASIL